MHLSAHSVLFSRSVASNSVQPRGLQHARLPCPSLCKLHKSSRAATGPQAAWVQKHRSSLCHCALCVQSASETGEKVKE